MQGLDARTWQLMGKADGLKENFSQASTYLRVEEDPTNFRPLPQSRYCRPYRLPINFWQSALPDQLSAVAYREDEEVTSSLMEMSSEREEATVGS